jgi:ABC-type multidrug transport system fused ATPase/permease subunit
MIFDEATSALDAESEYQVQQAIDRLVGQRDRTVVIVAHRLSTIINCDRIIVVKDGRIVEEGPHTQLL